MPYETNGSLTTNQKQISVSGGWATQTEWSNYQSSSNVDITNGVVSLSEVMYPAGELAWPILPSDTADSIEDTQGTHNAVNGADAPVTGDYWEDYSVRIDDGTGDVVGYNGNLPFIGYDQDWSAAITVDSSQTHGSDTVILNYTGGGSTTMGYGVRNGNINASVYYNSGHQATAGHPEPSAPYKIRLMAVYDNSAGDIELYMNAQPSTVSGSGGFSGNIGSWEGLTAGAGVSGTLPSGTNQHAGNIDNVRVFGRALTQSEVEADYNAQPWVTA